MSSSLIRALPGACLGLFSLLLCPSPAVAADSCFEKCGFSLDIAGTFAPRLPVMKLAAADRSVHGQLRDMRAYASFITFGFGFGVRLGDLYFPVFGLQVGLAAGGAQAWTMSGQRRLTLKSPASLQLLLPGIGRHWSSESARYSLAIRFAYAGIFTDGRLEKGEVSERISAFGGFGFGAVAESELCLRLFRGHPNISGLCVLTQPGLYFAGTSSAVAFVGVAGARLSAW